MTDNTRFNIHIGSTLKENLIELSLLFKLSCTEITRLSLHYFYDEVMGKRKPPLIEEDDSNGSDSKVVW
jgi:hypothetical protein